MVVCLDDDKLGGVDVFLVVLRLNCACRRLLLGRSNLPKTDEVAPSCKFVRMHAFSDREGTGSSCFGKLVNQIPKFVRDTVCGQTTISIFDRIPLAVKKTRFTQANY